PACILSCSYADYTLNLCVCQEARVKTSENPALLLGLEAPRLAAGSLSQRLTNIEARLKIVPDIDTLFTKIPAEIDFTTTTQAEKIDQTLLGVFQDAAETGQFIKQLTQRLRLLR